MACILNGAIKFQAMNPNSERIVIPAPEGNAIKLDWKKKDGTRGQLQIILNRADFNCLRNHFLKTTWEDVK